MQKRPLMCQTLRRASHTTLHSHWIRHAETRTQVRPGVGCQHHSHLSILCFAPPFTHTHTHLTSHSLTHALSPSKGFKKQHPRFVGLRRGVTMDEQTKPASEVRRHVSAKVDHKQSPALLAMALGSDKRTSSRTNLRTLSNSSLSDLPADPQSPRGSSSGSSATTAVAAAATGATSISMWCRNPRHLPMQQEIYN